MLSGLVGRGHLAFDVISDQHRDVTVTFLIQMEMRQHAHCICVTVSFGGGNTFSFFGTAGWSRTPTATRAGGGLVSGGTRAAMLALASVTPFT